MEVLFWVCLAVWLVALFCFVENEYGIAALVSTVVYGSILYYWFHIDLVSVFWNHPLYLVLGLIGYFIIGGIWACFRWYMFVLAKLDKYIEKKTNWLKSKGQTSFKEIPEDLKEEWAKYLEKETAHWEKEELTKPPLVSDHKTRIMRWIGYWPISGLSYVFGDMVWALCKRVYNFIGGWLQGISNRVFARINKDFQ